MSRAQASWLACSLGGGLFALCQLCSSSALAFCRTSTCVDCPRDPDTGCTVGGTPIAWPDACLSFSVNRAASAQVDLATATALMTEAFATWEAARCGSHGAPPSIHVSDAFGPAECGQIEYNPHAGNTNLIVFCDDVWPYRGSANELGLTSLTYDHQGVIYDADVAINATEPLSLGSSGLSQAAIGESEQTSQGLITGQHDLLSIMTHEAGHFLGLDHSRDQDAIMRVALAVGEVRTQLGADDVAGICAIYPPERALPACDPAPHGGFLAECRSDHASGCSAPPQPHASGPRYAGFGGLCTLLVVLRMRRHARRALSRPARAGRV